MSEVTEKVCVFVVSKSLMMLMFAIGEGVAAWKIARLQGSETST
jgi:hypothetical protein